jgi:hypothetical protein
VDPAEHLRDRLAASNPSGRRFDWPWRTGRAAALSFGHEG